MHETRPIFLLSALVLSTASVALAGAATGAVVQPAVARPIGATVAVTHARHHRIGGTVRSAWPKRGRAPRGRPVRWLARQVGATRPLACSKRPRHARARCRRGTSTRRSTRASLPAAGGDRGSPSGAVARIAGGGAPSAPISGTATASVAISALPLQLVRSYEIPADDPAYDRLLNWSWVYDSAVSAAAFAASGDRANAMQLLDQLAALQYSDGSLEIAFNTTSGEGAPVFRSGTVAWVGLAAASYDTTYATDRYRSTEQRAADYLLSLQTSSGLVRGGPDVGWVSTQHNLIAYTFLARLAAELKGAGSTVTASRYQQAAATISAAIDSNLLTTAGTDTFFRQGLNDDTRAVDVQALGAMYLQGTGQTALASRVLAYAQRTFAVGDRSIRESASPDTYNMSYASPGPLAGYTPYAGPDGPDVIWAEASGEMRLAQAALGQPTSTLDASIAAWSAIAGAGSLQASQTVRSDARDTDYHVWPASTATAWTVLARSAPAFFAAPLPLATRLVTDWTKVRGGNLVTTFTDGRVAMTTVGGERRVLDTTTPAADVTVTSTATLLSGAGYGIYVRASVDAATKLTGYCVQVDHTYGTGQIVVRQITGDVELGMPIGRINLPTGFVWYGTPHTVGVTVRGNTMAVMLDGTALGSVPDLAAASAAAVKYAYGTTSTITAPTAGGYGLRAWSDGLVTLQQMTVGPPG